MKIERVWLLPLIAAGLAMSVYACEGSVTTESPDGGGAEPRDAAPDTARPIDGSVAPEPTDAGPDADAGKPETSVPKVDAGDAGDAGDAAVDAADSGPPDSGKCIPTLATIGTTDFHMTFSMKSTATLRSSIVFQRAVCARGPFWDVRLMETGKLLVETDDGTHYVGLYGKKTVNDGVLHAIAIERSAGTVKLVVDGVVDDTLTLPPSSFGALPPLKYVAGHPCVGTDSTIAYLGTFIDLCISAP
jgi:hypothetical protein